MGPGESGNGKGETRNVMRRDAVRRFPFPASRFPALHGEGGIRTPDRGISPYNGLANRRLQPLGHLSNCLRYLNFYGPPAAKLPVWIQPWVHNAGLGGKRLKTVDDCRQT